MVKLTLEYDENDIHECIITCDVIKYKSELLSCSSNIAEQFINVLKNLYIEAYFCVKHEYFNRYRWIINYNTLCLPINISNITSFEENSEIDSNFVIIKTLNIDMKLFMKLFIELKFKEEHLFNANHIFISKPDLKLLCNTNDVPNKSFNGMIENIHIHYIPTINKSFVIDNYSLNR